MKEKKVQLFSGGFDSVLQEWMINPDILLYVDMHTSYSQRELEALDRLPARYQRKLVIKDLPLGEYERENKYLPYRNLILGTIAMEYGQHVYFGFNKTDDAPDKDTVFISRLTRLFEHLNINCMGDMGWKNQNFSFEAPFQNYTKTEMVGLCLRNGMPKDVIQHIRSCYDGESKQGCGVCNVCLNKAVALINNGIFEPGLFDEEITLDVLKNHLEYVKANDYKRCLATDYRQAIKIIRQQQK
jgi:7-cyano-7-deazaguanine synthase in queuosine biosynthesis